MAIEAKGTHVLDKGPQQTCCACGFNFTVARCKCHDPLPNLRLCPWCGEEMGREENPDD